MCPAALESSVKDLCFSLDKEMGFSQLEFTCFYCCSHCWEQLSPSAQNKTAHRVSLVHAGFTEWAWALGSWVQVWQQGCSPLVALSGTESRVRNFADFFLVAHYSDLFSFLHVEICVGPQHVLGCFLRSGTFDARGADAHPTLHLTAGAAWGLSVTGLPCPVFFVYFCFFLSYLPSFSTTSF